MTMPAPARTQWILLGVALMAGDAPSEAAAQDDALIPRTPLPIEVTTSASIMESDSLGGGQIRKLVPATDISEGQVVHYTLTVRNPGTQPAHDVLVTKPVPINTRYVPGSAVAPNASVTFSVDGGKSFAPANQLAITRGTATVKPAPPESYTHIRWQMRYPLAPGAVAYVRFRAIFQ
jgi:uncharacterized repeat protein (TIGR01451 family)